MGKFGGNNMIQRDAEGAQRQIPTLNVTNGMLVFCHMKNIIINTVLKIKYRGLTSHVARGFHWFLIY